MRILPISANLLPLEISKSRRSRKVRRLVIALFVGYVVLLSGWYGTARYETSLAEANLVQVERDVRGLSRDQNAYSDLVRTQADSKAISMQLKALLANDLRWSTLLASLRSAAPGGVEVTGVIGALNTKEIAANAPVDTIGTLTLTGTAPTKPAIAAYVDALGTVSGLAHPFLTNASEEDDKVSFTVRLDITKAALGGRYTPASTGSASAAPTSTSPPGGK